MSENRADRQRLSITMLVQETKAAFRAILSRPAFSALVVGVLGVGLACMMFMLVMINGFVLRPLPFPAPDELLHAGLSSADGGENLDDLPGRDLLALRRELDGQAEVAGFTRQTINLSDMDRPERFDGASVSTHLWRTLGVAPALGRDFHADDERPGGAAVVVLSWQIWHQRYARRSRDRRPRSTYQLSACDRDRRDARRIRISIQGARLGAGAPRRGEERGRRRLCRRDAAPRRRHRCRDPLRRRQLVRQRVARRA